MPKFNFLVAAAIALPLWFSTAQNKPLDYSTRDYDQQHVSLNLRFDFTLGLVFGQEELTVVPLTKKFNVLRLHSKTTTVNRVRLRGTACTFTADGELLTITLPKKFNPGDTITVAIDYTAKPERGMYFFTPAMHHIVPYQLWTQGQSNNNRYWYPAYDLPDDKLTSDVTVTIPAAFTSVGNGLLQQDSLINDSTRVMRWVMERPYSNYLTTLIVGEFEQARELLRGTALEYNMPPGWEGQHGTVYGRTPGMISFFSDYLLPYPYKRYAQTTVWDFEYGGMENASATTLNRRLLHTQEAAPNYDGDELICHELAHQWFGDLVTCNDWAHIWLNEGFTTYFTAAWYEFAKGRDEYLYMMVKSQDLFKEEALQSPVTKYQHGIPGELDGGNAYEKGAAVLHLLRGELGDSVFRKGMQEWLRRYADSTAVTEDFKRVMEEISGRQLDGYFKEWIYGSGFPDYHIQYEYDNAARALHIYVTQQGKVFSTAVPITIFAGAGRTEYALLVDSAYKHFALPIAEQPQLILFNRNSRVPCSVTTNQTLDDLGGQLLFSDDVTARIYAARELKKFGEASLVYYDQCLERELFYGVRIEAATAIGTITSNRSTELLTYAALDDDPRVKEAAYRAMATQRGENLKQAVLNGLECERNPYVRAGILYAAAKLGGTQMALSKVWEPSHMYIQRRAIFEGLSGNITRQLLDSAAKYIDYGFSTGDNHLLDPVLLSLARQGFATFREESAELTKRGLLNPYFRTRAAAASLAAELGITSLVPLMRELLSTERRESVKGALHNAILRLGKK